MVNYQRAAITNAGDIRAIVDNSGSHFFDANTMSFFKSRLLSDVIALDGTETRPGRRYLFITSERVWGQDARSYRVRMLTLGTVRDNRAAVDIDTLGAYESARDARRAAKALALAPKCVRLSCDNPATVETWCGYATPAVMCERCNSVPDYLREAINAHGIRSRA